MLTRRKTLVLTMAGILLMGVIPLAVAELRRGQFRGEMKDELNLLGKNECGRIAKDVYLMLRIQHEKLKKEVRHDLNVAGYVMNEAGGCSLSPERVAWTATNQFSGETVRVELNKVLVGGHWLEWNADPAVPSPVVDRVKELVGARCTIFQRMNPEGDLLRVATNVLKQNGDRAIGTFIPAKEPDGLPNQVVAAVLRGETYVGRAYVVDDWYLTAYEPIFDKERKVIGALFCGVRLEDIPELRQGIVDITVGRTGYAFVLGGSGDQKGRYIISRGGFRDGESILDSQDASGRFFIREILDKSRKLRNGRCEFTTYEWCNPGEVAPRRKTVATTYFEPWDWVIGAGTYEDDYQDALTRVDQAATQMIGWGAVGALVAFVLCGSIAWLEANRAAVMKREIAERKLAQSRQEQMLRRLECLNDLQKELFQPGSLAEKLQLITNAGTGLFDLDFCGVWQVEPGDRCSNGCVHATATDDVKRCSRQEQCLRLAATSNRPIQVGADQTRVPFGRCQIGRIAGGQVENFLTNDVANDPRVDCQDWAKRHGLTSFAGYRLRDSDGTAIGVLAAFASRDLTDEDNVFLGSLAETTSGVIMESRTDETIRQSEAKYRALFDASSDALMYTAPGGGMLSGNAAAIRLFACKDEAEFIQRAAADLSPERQPDGQLSTAKAEEMMRIAIDRGSHFFEWTHRRLDGSEFPATVLLSRVELEGRTVLLGTVRDVTAQKAAERALRESERRLANIIDFLPDATLAIDRNGTVIAWNRAMEEMTGISAEAMLGQGNHAYAVPFYGVARSALIDLVFQDDETREGQYRSFVREGKRLIAESFVPALRDGKGMHLWMTAAPLCDADGNVVGAIESIRDVTDRKEAEEALRGSERTLRLVTDSMRDVVTTVDLAGRITFVTPSIESLLGYSSAEFLRLTLSDVLTPPSMEKVRQFIEHAAAAAAAGQHADGETFEIECVRKDATTVIAEASTSIIRDESGATLGVQGIVRDITGRKSMEEERALATERMESLLALTHMTDKPMDEIVATVVEDAIRLTRSTIGYLALMNEDESVLTMHYWSKSAHAMCGVIDKPIVYPIETTGLWGEAVRQRQPVVTNDYAAPNPHKRGTPEGHVTVVRHMNIPVFDGDQIVAVAGVGNKSADYDDRDVRQLQLLMDGWWRIVKHRRYEAELAQARDDAQAASRAKSQFLATMSHEIRTPMTAILGYADLLTDPAITDEDRSTHVATIRRSGEHLLGLINDILDLSKIEAGKMDLNIGPCRLVAVLADVASLLRPRAEQQGVAFAIEYTGPIPATIRTDAVRLRQAIVNLAGNAVKFTEEGSVRIVTTFLPDGLDGRPAVRIDVVDTGIGIDEDTLPTLFRPFSQGDSSVTRRFGGTGLGLVISRHLVRMLGGDLAMASEVGKGSTFTLNIPTGSLDGVPMLENPTEATTEEHARDWTPEANDLTGTRILLAEDGLDNRRLIQTILRKVGAEIETAENGRIAVDKAGSQPFDLILMDMNMPEMDGYEATAELRRRGLQIPIIALTANAMTGDSELCRNAGCDEYLTKPIDRGQLVKTILACLRATPTTGR